MPTRIIVGTDHVLIRAGIRAVLRDDPQLALIAETDDGLEMLSLCRRLQPDLVILDVHLTRLPGLAVLRELAAVQRVPRLLIVSAYADAGSVRLALQSGAAGYLRTTVSGRDLLRAVHRVLDGEQVLLGVEGMLREESPLASQELVILRHVARGLPNREIAAHLGISERTVTTHISHICTKLRAVNRIAAVETARQEGLLTIQ